MSKKTSSGYDKATNILLELREVAEQFQKQQKFQQRFTVWVQPHLRRPAFVLRLEKRNFSLA